VRPEVELMFRFGFGMTAAAAAAAVAALLLAPGPASAGPTVADPTVAGPAVVSPAGGGHPSQQVMLITGDVVNVTTGADGRQTASVLRALTRGPGAEFQTFSEDGDLYVVPESAVPYLGSELSLSLFDVTRLAQQEHGARSLAVTVRLRGDSSPRGVPGVTLTHQAGAVAVAAGRLTEAGAREFGAALAGHAAGLLRGVAGISATGVPTPQPGARTAATKYTLTIHGLNETGGKDSGDLVLIWDVSDLKAYNGNATFHDGVATVKVPAGDYAVLCDFYDESTGTVDEVINPQFAVSASTSVSLDASSATSPVSVTTPKTSDPMVKAIEAARTDADGRLAPFGFIGYGQTKFNVQPVTSGVTVGKLYYYVYWRAFSPASAKAAYSYDVEFPSTGTIPTDEHYVVAAGSLASVASTYPANTSGQNALDARFGSLSWEVDGVTSSLTEFTTPEQRTEYYTASPAITWSGSYYAVFQPTPDLIQGNLDSSWTVYKPGQSLTATWGGQPEHPGLLQTNIFINHIYCPACLSGSTLDLLAFPFDDNTADHRSYPDNAASGLTESESYDVYSGSTKVTSGTGFLEDAVSLPSGTKDVQVDYDTTRSSAQFTLSTSADTQWTVQTSHAVTLPSQWYCSPVSGGTDCSVLPLMVASYDLPSNLLGQLGPGTVSASIDVSHLAGAAIAVSSAAVSVSFNGGTSWQKATVTAKGNGEYAVAFAVPAVAKTDGFGAIRLSATDADGGTLSQTIQHAFAVAAS
jgi:hypothetical protein